ncbi:unnamed protein product [Phytophthora lilii]|uniref:Unnamed protein product n=1 Tax=Phytophthora lilii TaxID=2077276 RepID=A0A9W6XDU2_9STRA|nr:unnamed protein product [Phytophthora lilii]
MSSVILSFGHYKGRSIEEVYNSDPRYCRWLFGQKRLFLDNKELLDFLMSKSDVIDKSYVLRFGKYDSKSVKWIYDNDKSYFNWLYTTCDERNMKLKESLELVKGRY